MQRVDSRVRRNLLLKHQPFVLLEFRAFPDEVAALRTIKRTKAGKHKQGRSLIDHPKNLYLSEQGLLYLALRFKINRVDLLGSTDSPWSPVPVDGIPQGWRAIHHALANGNSELDFARTQLRFQSDGSVIFVQSRAIVTKVIGGTATAVHDPARDRCASAPIGSLVEAWGTLMDDVQTFLLRELPELIEHYSLGDWLKYEKGAVLR
jgi:hypothetical protein